MEYALLINCGYAGYDGGCVAREGEYFYIFILFFFLRVGVHIFFGGGGVCTLLSRVYKNK